MADKITKDFSADVSVADGDRAVTAVITTAAVDRDNEVLIPQGMNSKDFEKNPVVFYGHNYRELPVGKVVALRREANGVTAKVVFAERPDNYPADEEWEPDTILSLFQQGVLRGFSVGLMPNEVRQANSHDKQLYGDRCERVISKWTLLELSVAALPANQEALAVAVSKGILTPERAKELFDTEMDASDAVGASNAADAGDVEVGDSASVGGEGEAKSARDSGEHDRGTSGPVPAVDGGDVQPHPVKRLIYFIDPPAPPRDVAADAKQLIADSVAKAKGRVYVI